MLTILTILNFSLNLQNSTLAFMSAGMPFILLVKSVIQERNCIQYSFDIINKLCFALDFVALGFLLQGWERGLCFLPLGIQLATFLVYQVVIKSMHDIKIDISFSNGWLYFQFLWLFIVIKQPDTGNAIPLSSLWPSWVILFLSLMAWLIVLATICKSIAALIIGRSNSLQDCDKGVVFVAIVNLFFVISATLSSVMLVGLKDIQNPIPI